MSKELDLLGEIDSKVSEKLTDLELQVKELKAKNGRVAAAVGNATGLRDQIQGKIHLALSERELEIKSSESGSLMRPYEIKSVANIASTNLSDKYQSYIKWQPGMEPTGQFHFRDLVSTILSSTDFVQFPRANTPFGEGSFGRQSEGATKAQIDRDYTMIDVTLKPMAAFAIASRQSLRNIVFLQSWLPKSMMDQLEDSEDLDFSNILVGAATGSTSTTKTVLPEKLISYMKTLIKSKYNPTAICCDPDVWEDLLVYRPGTDNPYSLPGPITVDTGGNIRLLNRPVYPVNWLTGRRIIVGDFSKAAIVQSEGLIFRQSDSHASVFTSNEVVFLLERTEALALFRPDAFITTTV
jgi:hypothetical protein